MLKELIKKYNKKIILSSTGILTILTMLLPFVIIGMGIYLVIVNLNTGQNITSPILILAISVFFMGYTFKRTKEFFVFFKYIKKPEEFPCYKNLIESGLTESELNIELEEVDAINALSKTNPLIITSSLIIGASKYSFFIMAKKNLLWAYEYNGNGLVLFDKYKTYGYVAYPTVDGNDEAIAKIEEDCPYAYFGLDFDYKKVMHDELDKTIEEVQEKLVKYNENPSKYRDIVLNEIKNKEENEKKKLEEEKNRQLEEIEKREKESKLIKNSDSIKESEE